MSVFMCYRMLLLAKKSVRLRNSTLR